MLKSISRTWVLFLHTDFTEHLTDPEVVSIIWEILRSSVLFSQHGKQQNDFHYLKNTTNPAVKPHTASSREKISFKVSQAFGFWSTIDACLIASVID